jgi:Uma2 family endonuclease
MPVAESKVDVPGITRPMTYEEYIDGPEEMARYDILDGWKVYRLYGDNLVPSPTRKHQRILGRLLRRLQDYEAQTNRGEAIAAPCDVEITYQPLRCRQPDLLFISRERLEQNAPSDEYDPLAPAPELVVEIVSASDTKSVLAAKIDDYRAVQVQEVWVVRPETQTVEVLTLADGSSCLFEGGTTASSAIFDGLTVSVDTIFQE